MIKRNPSPGSRRSALATLSHKGRGYPSVLLALCVVVATALVAKAQDSFPSRQISLIAPYAAGGSIDLIARLLAEGLTARLNQTVMVENKPGGNGVIGIREAIRARPDGHTLLMGSVGANVTPALMQPDYPFDPLRDYVPLSVVAEWSAILVVKKDLPVTTLAEFVAYAKARPGALNFGTTGFGSFAHLIAEVFMQQTGIRMQHVQYKGGSQATADLIAGTIDAHMMSSAVGAGQAENPNLKMLAVASPQRLKLIPRVPTMAEAGVAGVDQTSWLALFGPPALPIPVRERLNRELMAIANDPAMQTKFRNTGFEPVGTDAATTERFYREEVQRWSELVKTRGLAEKAR
jgi:tripartite-type tricarboxylate transporter receptor subunit TctC